MKKEILITIVFGLMISGILFYLAAIPYGADLANVYVRPLDSRDSIYDGVGTPPQDWVMKHGGLSERTMIFGNLRQIPFLMRDIDNLKKQVKDLRTNLQKKEQPKDPNEVKK